MIGRFIHLQNVLENEEIIEPDSYAALNASASRVLYVKRDFLYKSGEWRGNNIEAGISNAKRNDIKTIVVSHSDFKTARSDLLRIKATTRIQHVFGTNTVPFRQFSYSLPLGLTSDEKFSDVHHLFSDHSLLYKAHIQTEPKSSFDGTIYSNFNFKTNRKKRLPLLNLLPDLPYKVINHEPDVSVEGRVSYLSNLRSASLVLCPEGNGVDTHRLWETLYMGGTPVLLRNPALSSILDQLPVIQLKSWTQLKNQSFIEESWTRVAHFQWNPELLNKSYWQQKVLDTVR